MAETLLVESEVGTLITEDVISELVESLGPQEHLETYPYPVETIEVSVTEFLEDVTCDSLVAVAIQGQRGLDGAPGPAGGILVPQSYRTLMTAGVASVILPSLPAPGTPVQAYVNGVSVDHSLVGTTLTVTEYPAESITASDELEVFYYIV